MPSRGDVADLRALGAALTELSLVIAGDADARGRHDPAAAVSALLDAAITTTGARWASLTELTHGRATTFASTGIAGDADAAQYDEDAGPTLHAARTGQAVDVDLRAPSGPAHDWSQLLERLSTATPIRYVSSRPVLPTPSGRDGASLNLYSDEPFEVGTAGSLVATLASAVMGTLALRDRNVNLTIALDSAREIGAAIGIVMVTRRLPYEAGFEALRAASQSSGRKLRDIAAEVVLTGALPAQV